MALYNGVGRSRALSSYAHDRPVHPQDAIFIIVTTS